MGGESDRVRRDRRRSRDPAGRARAGIRALPPGGAGTEPGPTAVPDSVWRSSGRSPRRTAVTSQGHRAGRRGWRPRRGSCCRGFRAELRSRASLPLGEMKRYHVTTFGCQMNEHDSERMKGMLESLGYAEAPSRDQADLILFNTCSIREKADDRFIAHLGEAKRLKRNEPGRGGRGGRVLGPVGQGGGVRAVPVRRRGVRAGPGAQAGRVPDQRLADRPGLLRVRGLHRATCPPSARESSRAGCRSASAATASARTASCPSTRGREVSRPAGRAGRRGPRLAADGVREVTLLGQNVNSYGRDLPRRRSASLRRAAGPARCGRGHRPDPLHEPPPEGHARGRDRRACRAAVAVRAHPPAAAVGLEPSPQADAPHLHARALPRPRGDDPRARPRLRDHHRHHRRLSRARPTRTSSRRCRWPRRSATTARSRSSTRPAAAPRRPTLGRPGCARGQGGADGATGRGRPAPGPRTRSAVRRAHARGAGRGPSRTDPSRLRGRSRHNKVVNFSGLGAAGDLVDVQITGATSQTLTGEASLVASAVSLSGSGRTGPPGAAPNSSVPRRAPALERARAGTRTGRGLERA